MGIAASIATTLNFSENQLPYDSNHTTFSANSLSFILESYNDGILAHNGSII
jgi:hypothetical protein